MKFEFDTRHEFFENTSGAVNDLTKTEENCGEKKVNGC